MIAIQYELDQHELDQHELDLVVEQVRKRFDAQSKRFGTTCRDEMVSKAIELNKNGVLADKTKPAHYLYTCLANEAKTFYKRLADQWKNEKTVSDWNVLESVERTKSGNGPLFVCDFAERFDLKMDYHEFVERLDPRDRVVIPVLTGMKSAKNLAMELNITDKAIYKKCQKLKVNAKLFFEEYAHGFN